MSVKTCLIIAAAAITLAAHSQPGAWRQAADAQGGREWPLLTAETKPWTRWWWHGSAVDRRSLTEQLEALRTAGLGGVEVTPIYGVRGAEKQFIQYLSAEWVRMLEHTIVEGGRLGLGVDVATGTGWPFGGPWVTDDIAPRTLAHRTWTLAGGGRLTEPVRLQQTPLVRALGNQIHIVNEGAPGDPPRSGAGAPAIRPGARVLRIGDLAQPLRANRNLQELALEQVKFARDMPLVSLIAYGTGGDVLDITSRVTSKATLDWTAPPGTWTLYGIFAGWHGKLVERAAPGGEGYVIDHFSRDAIRRYLAPFDRAFAGARLSGLRAFFNDSYEVDDASGQADWTPRLFDEFQKRRGYDLRHHLPALFGPDGDERSARVLADYRETISDVLLDTFTAEWNSWAHRRNSLTRNQAHGSPASLLDLYAASDIPETEGAEVQRFKWAVSAGNVAGRRLVSAEAATWLGEHFRSTLADVRTAVDRFFAGGVNHIVYHGTAYSPTSEPWPGWLFYASVAFSPQQAWWDDFAALNAYVARVQSLLQRGRADHDVLLYYPLYDALSIRGKSQLAHFGGANPPAQGTAFEASASAMQDRGFTYDFISDRQLRRARVERGRLVTAGGGSYAVVILPASRFVPLETFEHVLALARAGATVISAGGWAADVAGLAQADVRGAALRKAAAAVAFGPAGPGGIREARFGSGLVLQGDDVAALLERAGVARETLVDHGLAFTRRIDEQGRIYFVSNPTDRAVDGWIPLATAAPVVTVFDPMDGRNGYARVRRAESGKAEVYLQIPASGSLLLAPSSTAHGRRYDTYEPAGASVDISGPWTLRFVKGGPSLPAERTVDRLISWTVLGGEDLLRFSGTAVYRVSFPRPSSDAGVWRLELGSVHESARVRLNGQDLGTFIGPVFTRTIEAPRFAQTNVLEVSVTNLSANRIADLDRRGIGWKKFYNVNYPARLAENRGPDGLFSTAAWKPLPSGLLGPVRLTPLRPLRHAPDY